MSCVSFPTCFLGFDIPTSSFIFIENASYYSCFHCFAFLNGVNIFCRLHKYSYIIIIHVNHTIIIIFIKICSSMKVSLCIYQFFYAFFFIYRWCLFSISLTALSAVLVSVTVSTIQYSHSYIILLYNGFNCYIHCYKNVFAHKRYCYAYEQQALPPFQLPCSEYTNAHAWLHNLHCT